MNLKREIKSADIRNLIICSAVSIVVGTLSYFFTGGLKMYYGIMIPVFSLPVSVFTVIRLIMFGVAGLATGLIIGNCDSCRKSSKINGIVLFSILTILCAFRSVLIFGFGTLLVGFILSLIILIVNFFVMRFYVKISLISGFSMLAYFLWNIYVAFLSFCILILN